MTLNKNLAILVVDLVLVHAIYCRSGLKSDHIPLLHIIVFFLLHHSHLSLPLLSAGHQSRKVKKGIQKLVTEQKSNVYAVSVRVCSAHRNTAPPVDRFQSRKNVVVFNFNLLQGSVFSNSS